MTLWLVSELNGERLYRLMSLIDSRWHGELLLQENKNNLHAGYKVQQQVGMRKGLGGTIAYESWVIKMVWKTLS